MKNRIFRFIAPLLLCFAGTFLQAQKTWVQVSSSSTSSGYPRSTIDTSKDAPIAQQSSAHRGGRGAFLSYLNAAGKWVFIVPTDDGSLYRSGDGGKTFTKVFTTPWPNSRPQHAVRLPNGVLYVAFAPVSSEISKYDGPGGGSSAYPNHNSSYTAFDARYELFRSGDDGVTWEDTNLATTIGIPTAGNSVKVGWGDWWAYNSGHKGIIEDYWTWTDPGLGSSWSSIYVAPSPGCPAGGYIISGESTRTGGSAADNWASASWDQSLVNMGYYNAGGCGGGGGPNLTIQMPFGGSFNGENWVWCNTESSSRVNCMPARGGTIAAPDGAQTGLVFMWVAYHGGNGMHLQDGSEAGPAGSTEGYSGFEHSAAGANGFYATTYGGQVFVSTNAGANWTAVTSYLGDFAFQGARIILTNLNSSKYGDNRLAALTQDVSGDNAVGGTRLWVWDAAPTAPVVSMTVDGSAASSGTAVCSGQTVAFQITTGSTDPEGDNVIYQWQKYDSASSSFKDIPGATSNTYSTVASTAANYRVLAWDTYGVDQVLLQSTASNENSFTVLPAPGFSQVPTDAITCPLTSQVLTFRVSGPPSSVLSTNVYENGVLVGGMAPAQVTLDSSGYGTIAVTIPASRLRNTAQNGLNVIYTYRVRVTAISGSCGGADSPDVNVTVMPEVYLGTPSAPTYSACASNSFTLQANRRIIAPEGSTVTYRLVDGSGNQSYSLSLAGGYSSETVPSPPQMLSGTLSLAGDLTAVSSSTTLYLMIEITQQCGSGAYYQSPYPISVVPPAIWGQTPQAINTAGVSGFSYSTAFNASMQAGTQSVTWNWQMGALAGITTSDYVTASGSGWPGTITSATSSATSFVPEYFSAAGSLIPNGSFESSLTLGTDVTLAGGAAGLSVDTTRFGYTSYGNTGSTDKMVAHGSNSLRVGGNGVLRFYPSTSYLIEVGADSSNLAGQVSMSKTNAWLVLAAFGRTGSSPTFRWQAECFGADRSTLLGTVDLDGAPVVPPDVSLASTNWLTYGYIVKTNGGLNAANLISGTAYWRPVVVVSGADGATNFLRVDDVRVIPISSTEETLLRSAGAVSSANNRVVAPTIDGMLGVDASGSNTGQVRVNRVYVAQPTQTISCGSAAGSSTPVTAPSESRLVILRNPYNATMTLGGDGLWTLTLCQGDVAALTMAAASGGTNTYEWQGSPDASSWTVAPSSTGTGSYTVPTATSGTTYYRVVVSASHSNGEVETKVSSTVKVVVTPPLSNVVATSGTYLVNSGSSMTPMSVTYSGGGSPTFQWGAASHGSGSYADIAGATGGSFTPAPVAATGSAIIGYDYRVILTPGNGCGGPVTAFGPTIGVVPAVAVSNISSTQGQVVCAGNNGSSYPVTVATQGVGASSTLDANQPVSLVWSYRVNGGAWVNTPATADMSGNSTFLIDSSVFTAAGNSTSVIEVQATVTGLYISGGVGTTRSASTPIYSITINPQASITSDPATPSSFLCSGTTTVLSVGATGLGVTLQWQELSPEPSSAWADLSGETSSSLVVPILASPAALNNDPSFESGISDVEKLAGVGTFGWDGTTPAAQGTRSIGTTGGAITLGTPKLSKVPVVTSNYYLVLGSVFSDTTGRKATLGLRCYDASGALIAPQGAGDLALFRPIPSAKSVVVGNGSANWIVLGGIVRGEGALLGTNGEAATFRTGTASVQLVASLEEGASSGTAHIDNLRLIPLSVAEANLLTSKGGANLAAYALARLGAVSDGTSNRVFQYRAVLGNPNGCGGSSLTSQAAVVTAVPLPVILSVPDDQTVCADQAAVNLAVAVQGGGTNNSFQWYSSPNGVSNWLPVVGGNAQTISVPATNPGSTTLTTYYRLQIATSCGSLQTRAIKVDITPSAAITSQISGPTSICDGQQATMSVAVRAGTIQWQKYQGNAWVDVVGATNPTYAPTLTLADPAIVETPTFRVVNVTSCATVTSNTFSIEVDPVTAITSQTDANTSICSGGMANLGVVARGKNLRYAWSYAASASGPWTPVLAALGGNQASLSVSPTASGNTATVVYYQVSVSGDCGGSVLSQVFSVTSNPVTTLTTLLPSSLDGCSGASKTLSVTAAGVNPTFTWTETSPEGTVQTLSATTPSITVPLLAPAAALNANPSFESGIGTLVRTSGQAGSALALDSTNPASEGSSSIRTTGGAIEMRSTGLIPVDSSQSYVLLASTYSEAASGAKFYYGVECYDENRQLIAQAGTSDLRSYRCPVETSNIAMPTGAWTPVGGLIGGGEGTWNGTGVMPFRAGTRFVQIMVSVNEGSASAVGHLDNLRLIPVSSSEIALVAARPSGKTLAQYFEERMGKGSSGVQARAFTYQVTVSGACVSNGTSSVQVTANPNVTFTAQPADAEICAGGSGTSLEATVYGAGSPSYTWQRSSDLSVWQAITGANSPSYAVVPPTTLDADQVTYYRLQVITSCGAVFSRTAKVTTHIQPSITKDLDLPSTVCSGTTLTLTVSAKGTTTRVWERSINGDTWTPFSTSTADTVTYVPTATGNSASTYNFRVHLGSPLCGEILSTTKSVTVNPSTAITTQPQSFTGCFTSNSVSLEAAADGVNNVWSWQISTDGGLTYAAIANATGTTYIPKPATGSTYPWVATYRAVVTGACGTATTNPATVRLEGLPTISQQPASVSIANGQSTTLSVSASVSNGSPAPVFQWEISVDGGSSFSTVTGATSSTLNTGALTAPTGKTPKLYLYRVQVKGAGCDPVVSGVATVTVYPPLAATPGATVTMPACTGVAIPIAANLTSGYGATVQWQGLNGSAWSDLPGATGDTYQPVANTVGFSLLTKSFRPVFKDEVGQTLVGAQVDVTWAPAPAITVPPVGFVACQNGSGTLKVDYKYPSGTTVRTVWESSLDQKAWTETAETGTTLALSNLTQTTYYRFHVISIVGCGEAIAGPVTVEVKADAMITQQPTSQVVCDGSGATLTVATNRDDATFQWYVCSTPNGTFSAMSGQTQASLVLSNLANQTGVPVVNYYRVQVTPTGCGQPILSSTVSVTIRPGTVITSQPLPVDTCVGTPASVGIGFTGEAVVVTWWRNTANGWVDLGLTGASVSIPAGVIESYDVRAQLVGGCGTVFSNPVTIKVSGPTKITAQPASVTVCQGSDVQLHVGADGAALSYQWEQRIPGAATWTAAGNGTADLTVIAAQTMEYRVTVRGGAGCNDQVVSDVATVTVDQIPQEVPLNVPVFALSGHRAYVSLAKGAPAYGTVTWSFLGQSYTGNSAVLQMPASAGVYKLYVQATAGNCQSATVWNLSVVAKGNGDSDQNGRIDGIDFARMEAAFGLKAGDPGYDAALDLNGDGVIDSSDEALLLGLYGQAVTQGASTSASIASSALQAFQEPQPALLAENRQRKGPKTTSITTRHAA